MPGGGEKHENAKIPNILLTVFTICCSLGFYKKVTVLFLYVYLTGIIYCIISRI